MEREREAGATIDQALTSAVQRRIRPILLTAATTIAGLLPLALGAATLWPPLAWAIISGLLASTALCLIVVPALYRLLFRRQARTTTNLSNVVTSGRLAL
jgi:multidrug efflux pump